MKTRFYIVVVGVLIAFTGALKADTLELKNGQLLNGQYVGGTEQTVRFMTGGETKVIPRDDIVALTMSGKIPANAGATSGFTGTTTGTGASSRAAYTLPAGTPLQVRVNENLNSGQPGGTKFSGALVQPLIVNGVTIAPAGTAVYGQIAQSEQTGRFGGQSGLALVLTDIDINGHAKRLVTSPVGMSGQFEGRRTLRVLRQGEAVNVPAGATMQFNLSQPLTVP